MPPPVWLKAHHIALATAAGAAMVTYFYYYQRKMRKRPPVKEAVVVENLDSLEPVVSKIKEDTLSFKVLGLDCEWCSDTSSGRRPVALLQLATVHGYSALIRLCKLDSRQLPQSLQDLLADKSILKVGVAVLDDANRLLKDHQLLTRGCLDLRHLAQRHAPSHLMSKVATGGLGSLAEIFADETLDKSDAVRCGDWEVEALTPQQVRYASRDALVAVEIFLGVIRQKLPVPAVADDAFWGRVGTMCRGLVDVKYKQRKSDRKMTAHLDSAPDKEMIVRKTSNAYRPRQSQMYHNCRLLAPDGQLLCTCHRQKAEWYVKKDIGVVDCDEPFTVKLKFEPSGTPGVDRAYYLQDKDNRCVVCGREDSYLRKNIVPHEYRRNFPENIKKHSSHDVLLLCLSCHQRSSSYDRIIRQQLVAEYNAPISNLTSSRYRDDPAKTKVRSAAKALRRPGNVPDKRVAQLQKIILDFWERCDDDDVGTELIEASITMDVKCENEDFRGAHGDKVVAVVMLEEDGLERFEARWRKHFLETMKPQFLPSLWSVHHRHKTGKPDDVENGKVGGNNV